MALVGFGHHFEDIDLKRAYFTRRSTEQSNPWL
jgi:hypothetical protein